MFSFFLNTELSESYIFFGGYEENKIKDIEWMELDKDKLDHWNVYFRKLFLKNDRGIDI